MDYLIKEMEMIPILSKFFDETIEKIQGEFAIMDFKSDKSFYELKTRTCKSTQYHDTMVGFNKIIFARENQDKNVYFIFKFTDGIFYWKYDNEGFRTDLGGRTDRGKNEIKKYAYIPLHILKRIET